MVVFCGQNEKKSKVTIESTTHFSDSPPRAIFHRKNESIVKARAGIVQVLTHSQGHLNSLQFREKMCNWFLSHASGACGHESIQE